MATKSYVDQLQNFAPTSVNQPQPYTMGQPPNQQGQPNSSSYESLGYQNSVKSSGTYNYSTAINNSYVGQLDSAISGANNKTGKSLNQAIADIGNAAPNRSTAQQGLMDGLASFGSKPGGIDEYFRNMGLDPNSKEVKDFKLTLATENLTRSRDQVDDFGRELFTNNLASQNFTQQIQQGLMANEIDKGSSFNYGVGSALIGSQLDAEANYRQAGIDLRARQEDGRQQRLSDNNSTANQMALIGEGAYQQNLSNEYLSNQQLRQTATEGAENRLGYAEQGYQQRLNTELLVNSDIQQAMYQYEGTKAMANAQLGSSYNQLQGVVASANAGIKQSAIQGYENRLNTAEAGYQQRQAINTQSVQDRIRDAQAQTAQLKFIAAEGNEQRLGITEQGYQQRLGINEQGYQNRLQASQEAFDQRNALVQGGYEDRLLANEQGYQQRLAIAQQNFEGLRMTGAQGYEQRLGLNEQARLSDQSKDLDSNRSRNLAMRWGGDVWQTEANYRPADYVDYGPVSRVEREAEKVAPRSAPIAATTPVDRTTATQRTVSQGLQDYGTITADRSMFNMNYTQGSGGLRDGGSVSASGVKGTGRIIDPQYLKAAPRTETVGPQSYQENTAVRDAGRDYGNYNTARPDADRYEKISADERASADAYDYAASGARKEALDRAKKYQAKPGEFPTI